MKRFFNFVPVKIILPGILVAATGVGAGDLATASFTGNLLGTSILWAVVLGALLKFVLNEGLARWQLASGFTLLEGAIAEYGKIISVFFLPYLLIWSFFVGAALMGACGVTSHAIYPLYEDPNIDKIVYGVGHSLLGLGLVLFGGFKLFEKIMSFCISVMFLSVLTTAAFLWPGFGELAQGLIPQPWDLSSEGLTWTIALMGGVGGTLTILCYGYWIREENREGVEYLQTCRIDLAVAYIMIAVFGMAMIIIASGVDIEGKGGAKLLVNLADHLEKPLGSFGRWTFLIGAWGTVFSSLLGVWQSVPYIFADFYQQVLTNDSNVEVVLARKVNTSSKPYRGYLFALAFIPMLGLFYDFREVQKIYAVVGAFFMPLLAMTLLALNAKSSLLGKDFTNGRWAKGALLVTVFFFSWILWVKLSEFIWAFFSF